MSRPTKIESEYRKAEDRFGKNEDEFFDWLEQHRYDDWTLCIGWALMRANRVFGRNQVEIAALTAITDSKGRELLPGINKAYISSMLSGTASPPARTYDRLARACGVNPLEFYLAEGWLTTADIAAFSVPDRALALPILEKLDSIPMEDQPAARAVVLSVLDTLISTTQRLTQRSKAPEETPKPIATNEVTNKNARAASRRAAKDRS